MSRAQVFLNNKNKKKIDELKNKIFKELDGYTSYQIETCFNEILDVMKISLIIDCSVLLDLQDENP